jgi:general secretion pathway protein F
MSAIAAFRYRAIRPDGTSVSGEIAGISRDEAVARIRAGGAAPVELAPIAMAAQTRAPARARAASRALIGELAVLLRAGLPLDRALTLAIDNIEDATAARAMVALLAAVREGAPLSRTMLDNPALFSPAEAAMAEAGEAGGRLAEALERLSLMLEQAADLSRMVTTALIYPVALMVIAVGVIAMMLLFVVPQFDRLLTGSNAQLPAASMAVIMASRWLQANGLWALLALGIGAFGLVKALARPAMRSRIDAWLLRLPLLGELIRRIDTARFAHTLSALLDGGVPLPNALLLAQRTIGNAVIAGAIGKVAEGLREGGGLAAPLAASGVLPRMALAFVRTGEETSELAMMLSRLALVLDRDVRTRLERLVALLTPTITVVLGAAVAGIIASIMSAILGFNDLAVSH